MVFKAQTPELTLLSRRTNGFLFKVSTGLNAIVFKTFEVFLISATSGQSLHSVAREVPNRYRRGGGNGWTVFGEKI